MTSNQLVERMFCFVHGVVESGIEDGKMSADTIGSFLKEEYSSEDREIALGLAFSRWNGPELSKLVAALSIPREQRMFIRKAGLRLSASKSKREKTLLVDTLSALRLRFADLTSAVSEALGAVEPVEAHA